MCADMPAAAHPLSTPNEIVLASEYGEPSAVGDLACACCWKTCRTPGEAKAMTRTAVATVATKGSRNGARL